jgi:hypothetical protein
LLRHGYGRLVSRVRRSRGADVSDLYQEFALGVAQDADVLAFLGTLPQAKRQISCSVP